MFVYHICDNDDDGDNDNNNKSVIFKELLKV